MRAHRVWLPGARPGAARDLPPEEAHHLARVLRCRPGDAVVVTGAGGELFDGRVAAVEDSGGAVRVRVEVGLPCAGPALEVVPWTVAVGVAKERNLELAVRMASEVGLEGLVPLLCERGQVHLRAGPDRSRRLERWERIARESAKQCGRAVPLAIGAPVAVDAVVAAAHREGRSSWLLRPGAGPVTAQVLAGSEGLLPAVFLIGPEGGFSPGEAERALALGAGEIGFRTPILRTPTAVMLVAALRVVAEDWGRRNPVDDPPAPK